LGSIVCWYEADEVRCEGEEERRARELEERIKQHVEAKIQELLQKLVQEYEIEVSLDPNTMKGVGRWRRKQS